MGCFSLRRVSHAAQRNDATAVLPLLRVDDNCPCGRRLDVAVTDDAEALWTVVTRQRNCAVPPIEMLIAVVFSGGRYSR